MTDPETLAASEAAGTSRLQRLARPAHDPGVRSGAVLVALAVVAFVMFGLAWRGIARTIYVPLQMPWLLSGGFMALALLGLALGAWSIHLSRRDNAVHRAAFEDFVHETAELAEGMRTGRVPLPGRKPARKRAPAKKA
ncbi:MAG TPA: hypothetical protein VHD81_08075 [Mycobacteriales bacterium]|nr:hypothetical protein [Mycobacteriales bacterium]